MRVKTKEISKTNTNNKIISSVNFHLWEACNMSCKFCFASFQDVKRTILPKGHLSKEDALNVIKELASMGFKKITFAGGEPTLCPWINDLISLAKELGMVTMIITNGSQLTDRFLEENKYNLDWLAISVDSLDENTNTLIGRSQKGNKVFTPEVYYTLISKIKAYGYGLKINTVVNRFNYNEDMRDFIKKANPKRWKIMQVLPIKGQNDEFIDSTKITEEEFQIYLDTHKEIKNSFPENNESMKGSYAMVDPAGRFFDNTKGEIRYSKPILNIGGKQAIKEMNYSFDKFVKRGGLYEFDLNKDYKRITISGTVASGKSTVGKILAKKLKYQFLSIGQETRIQAKKENISILEMQERCLNNSNLDKKRDKEFSNRCNNSENLIIDYRLGAYFIKSALSIYLKVTKETALERLKKANRENETYHTISKRNDSFRKQFMNAYNIDYTDESKYDLVINADNKRANEIANIVLNHINMQTSNK